MILAVKIKKDYRVLKKGEKFIFKPGVNLLVGDQGSGKSSLLGILNHIHREEYCELDTDKITHVRYLDFEKHNPRVGNKIETMGQFLTLMSSHGQSINVLLKSLIEEFQGFLVMLDEPDSSLSIRSCHKLIDTFNQSVKLGSQIIAAVHNPIIIDAFEEVLSMEHRKWMPSKEFIEIHSKKI